MIIINKKHYFIIFLTVFFLLANVFTPEIARITGIQYSSSIAYAKGARGSSGASGGFKSGSFKSSSSYSAPKSSSGGFKSGNFSTTPKSSSGSGSGSSSNSGNYSSPSSKSYNGGTKRSYIPIPIPIPWGSRNYGQSYSSLGGIFSPVHFIGSIVFGIFKFILLAIVFIIIFNIIRKIRRRF